MSNMDATPTPSPAPSDLPHNTIGGLSDDQADRFVELAYANKGIAETKDQLNWLEADEADALMRANDSHLGRLANVAMGKPEITPIKFPTPPESTPRRRRNTTPSVVNPRDGRIVKYGQMQPGNHPQGGRIVY